MSKQHQMKRQTEAALTGTVSRPSVVQYPNRPRRTPAVEYFNGHVACGSFDVVSLPPKWDANVDS